MTGYDLEIDDSCAMATVVALSPKGEEFLKPFRPQCWGLHFSSTTRQPIGLVFDLGDRKSADAFYDLFALARAAEMRIH